MARPKVISAADAARSFPTTRSSLSHPRPRSDVPMRRSPRSATASTPRAIRATSRPCTRSPPGDMWGVKGIDHLAKPGCLARVLAGSYPSGPSSAEPPEIWKMITSDAIPAYNVPSGILFDIHREAAAKRPGVLTKVGMDTFVDPVHEGCAMNAKAAADPIVAASLRRRGLAVLSDHRSRRRDHPRDDRRRARQPLLRTRGRHPRAARPGAGGAQQRRHRHRPGQASRGGGNAEAPRRRRARHPGRLHRGRARSAADHADGLRAGDLWRGLRPLSSFETPKFDIAKVIARRVAKELRDGDAVNIGFGISANVPRILIEEGRHGAVTWVIEQGAVGGVPLLDFQFGCASNAEAIVQSPHQLLISRARASTCRCFRSCRSIAKGRSTSPSSAAPACHRRLRRLRRHHGARKRIVFSGYFTAGASSRSMTARSDRQGRQGQEARRGRRADPFSGPRAVVKGRKSSMSPNAA